MQIICFILVLYKVAIRWSQVSLWGHFHTALELLRISYSKELHGI